MVALLVLLSVVVFLTIDYLVQRGRQPAVVATEEKQFSPAIVYEPAAYRTPAGVYFDPGHTWTFLGESGEARVGIDEFARSIVGNIDGITTLPVGETVRKGDAFLRVRHGNRDAVFRAPIDGVVTGVNATALVNRGESGAYTDDWIYTIEPRDTSTLPERMRLGTKSKEWLSREVDRLRVFLATTVPGHPVLGETMQDGGLPRGGLIDHLGDDEWNKLHEHFFGRGSAAAE